MYGEHYSLKYESLVGYSLRLYKMNAGGLLYPIGVVLYMVVTFFEAFTWW